MKLCSFSQRQKQSSRINDKVLESSQNNFQRPWPQVFSSDSLEHKFKEKVLSIWAVTLLRAWNMQNPSFDVLAGRLDSVF